MRTTNPDLSRRSFITRATGAITLPLVLNGLPLQAFDGPLVNDLFNANVETDRVLVLIQLNGGNDGLNTVIPLDTYSSYQKLRSNIAIPTDKVLKLRDEAGLHPAMTGVHRLWSEQKVGVIHGVTYPNPNQSHFRSNDIWMSGSSSNVNEPTGWVGRYLNTQYPTYPEGYPNAAMPDPIAIQISAVVGLALTGLQRQSMGIALQDPEAFYRLVSGSDEPGTDVPSAAYAASNVRYVREVQSKSMQFSTVIKAAADKAKNIAEYPTNNRLADQLKIVARLIAGGLKTRVYVVQLNGFDTHAAQVDAQNTTIGAHALLLQLVSDAVAAFQSDIEQLGAGDRVVSMTFSEFGRRAASNQSLGTDHGTAAPLFFFGVPVEHGIVGSNPDLENLDNGNLRMQHDFRQIYASVLQQWFGADPGVTRSVLFDQFSTVKVIKGGTTSVNDYATSDGSVQCDAPYPNPVRDVASLRMIVSQQQHVRMDVFDARGFHVTTLINEQRDAGEHTVPFDATQLPSGSYHVQVRARGEVLHRVVVVAR